MSKYSKRYRIILSERNAFLNLYLYCKRSYFKVSEVFRSRFVDIYTRGQVSVNKRISVLSNYFDVSFEIYYVRLKYIGSIGQIVQLLILRPASICCTFNSGHIGSRAPDVNKMGCLFYFHTSRIRLKRKYLFRSRKKEIIILHSTNVHVRCTIQQNGSQSESTIEISGCVTVFSRKI